jgi:hypothetical protein
MQDWLDKCLAAEGRTRTGPLTCPHDRPWGRVFTAPTDAGPVWLKAPGPTTVFEVALYELLGRITPDRVLRPIAVDVERGWVLLPDGGEPLGARLDEVDVVDVFAAVLPQYAQLQRELDSHTADLLSFGIADMRPAAMPDRFDEAVAAVGAERVPEVVAMRPRFVDWCARLAASAVPASLDHNDLHPWNVFMTDGRARFYDWGDAVVAHPFASALVPFAMIRSHLSEGPDHPTVRRLRDGYLEAWTDRAPHAELVADLETACWVAKVARALTWDRALRAQGADQAGEFTDAPYEHLVGLLSDSWSDL